MKLDSNPFEVYVRIRPIFSQEASKKAVQLLSTSEYTTELSLVDPLTSSVKQYSYNGVFSEKFSNNEVYTLSLQKLMPRLLDGYNTTCFAYGSTGAGKTHTMFGHGSNLNSGLAYLSIQDCFNIIPKHVVKKMSFLEIYNETIIDLLGNKNKTLMIVEDPVKGVVVPELNEYIVTTMNEVLDLINRGNKNRARGATLANEYSTRSHGVLQMVVETLNGREILLSKLCLIDLAGSERAASTENKGLRMKEGANINKSLLALGNCINILSDAKKKGAYVPFRDSKLTRLLKESLGGNSKTVMIACISPLQNSYEDTCQTLKYASRAKNITTFSTKVIKDSNYLEIINSLKNEIEILKMQLCRDSTNILSSPQEHVDSKQVSQQIINNFEEHWDLKQSIKEIEELNLQNQKLYEEATGNKKESIKQIIQENETRKNSLLQALYANMKQKQALQNKISEIKDETKREFLELQIQVRSLKLEKIDLFIQNSNFKQEAEEAKKESIRKDQIINQMKAEIESMKSKMQESQKPEKKELNEVIEIFEFLDKLDTSECKESDKKEQQSNTITDKSYDYGQVKKVEKCDQVQNVEKILRVERIERNLDSSKSEIRDEEKTFKIEKRERLVRKEKNNKIYKSENLNMTEKGECAERIEFRDTTPKVETHKKLEKKGSKNSVADQGKLKSFQLSRQLYKRQGSVPTFSTKSLSPILSKPIKGDLPSASCKPPFCHNIFFLNQANLMHPFHRPQNSLQQARNVLKTKSNTNKVGNDTLKFLTEYTSLNFKIDEEEEGKVNTPMITDTKIRTLSIGGAVECKIIKPGSFSGFQYSTRAESAGKLKKSKMAKPKLAEISMEEIIRKKKILQKKDMNALPKHENCNKKSNK